MAERCKFGTGEETWNPGPKIRACRYCYIHIKGHCLPEDCQKALEHLCPNWSVEEE